MFNISSSLNLNYRVVRALVLAAPHLKYSGESGKLFDLVEARNDVTAYLKLTDAVLREVCCE